MIEILQIDHVVLRTNDTDAMIRFYRDVLGCVIERELPAEKGLIQLRAGNALIDLVPVDSEMGRQGGGLPDMNRPNVDHICLQIAPCKESDITAWLDKHNISHGGFEQRYGAQGMGPSIYLTDPDGNTVELRNRM
ncbi:MAG: VOC family protein [Pseudohongiella nitratireducens]|nr:VOC family protein [Pseudohongiella nitratireducens]